MTAGCVTKALQHSLLSQVLIGVIYMADNMTSENERYPLRLSYIAIVLGCAAFFVFFIYITRENIIFYFRDPAATFGFSPFAGLISNIGIFVLLSAGAISIFSFFQNKKSKFLLLWVGLFSAFLAMDDFFMLHEDIIPRKLGIPEIFVYASYGFFVMTIIIAFFGDIAGKRHIGLYTSVILLAFSVIVDITIDSVVAEDTLKFLGIVLWSAYWIRQSHFSITPLWRDSENLAENSNESDLNNAKHIYLCNRVPPEHRL